MDGDSGLTDDERIKIGQQQAALIQMQKAQQQQQMMRAQQEEQDLMEAQRQALQFNMDQERQQLAEQQSRMLRSMEEQKKEEELARLQQIALMERQKEQQMNVPGGGGPPMPPIPPMAPPQSVPQQMGPPMARPQQSMSGAPPMGQSSQPMRGGAPQQMGGPPPQQMGGPPPQQMGGPQQMQPMGGAPQMAPRQPPLGGPPQQMGGFQQQMGGPNQPMGASQQQMRGPPHDQRVPPQQLRGPHDQMGGPPDRLGGPSQSGGPSREGGIPSLMATSVAPVSQSQQGGQFSNAPRSNNQSGPPQGRFSGPPQGGSSQNDIRDGQGPSGQFSGGRGPPPMKGAERDGPPPSLMQMETRPPLMQKGGDDDDEEEAFDSEDSEFKLPPALEKVLAFKDARVQEVGVKPEEMERIEQGELVEEEGVAAEREAEEREAEERRALSQQRYIEQDDDDEDDEPARITSKKESKNKKRKKKKKKAKQRNAQKVPTLPPPSHADDDVEVEYVQEELQMDRTDPSYREFSKIFEAFKIAEPEKPQEEIKKEEPKDVPKEKPPKQFGEESDDDSDAEEKKPDRDDDKPKLSKKKQKKLSRLSVAELKQLVVRPDVVEMHDVTARDPKLLVHLKATKNTVPVPRHWCFKRKYLQGKRGIEKMPFDLPDFIKNTGIMEMRQALQDKEEAKNLKAKMREKVRPKMGKIDIDYQKLHDAFFKYQTKPKMTIHGDLYYEGKEFETKLKEKKPGDLSDDMRTALGMPIGPNAQKYPPPWLIAMQRYGPPPSYPNQKIPGLNSPIPESCSFGYHAGGWGKPPVDETGKPLYGDVFGQSLAELPTPKEEEDIDKTLWGELESESEEDESEEEESDDDKDDADASGLVTPGDPGLASVTPSGTQSVPVGVETPDMIELRKKRIEDAMDQGGDTPALYQVLKEKTSAVGGAMMGSAHVYELGAGPAAGKKAEGVEVALNPDELDLDTAAIQAKYDQQMREQHDQLEKEDLSDMVADHQAKQAKKRKKQQQDSSKSAKKYKEFKF